MKDDEKYIIEIVRPEDITDEMEENGLDSDTIDAIAIDYYKFTELWGAIRWLLDSLNSDNISDQNYYFLIEIETGNILEQPSYLHLN